jgi:RNA polymerase sigma-70 factor (ECF subfamily)
MWGRGSSNRDEVAFGAGLNLALPRLRRRAIAICGQVALADDLVQDCLERAWRARDSLTSMEMPFAWLCTILRNVHIDWLRRHKHDLHAIEIDEIAETLAIPGTEATVQTLDLIKGLQKLNPDQRSILLLAGVEGLSYQEIALELDVPVGTIMSRLARARQALRNLMNAEQEAPGRLVASPEAIHEILP